MPLNDAACNTVEVTVSNGEVSLTITMVGDDDTVVGEAYTLWDRLDVGEPEFVEVEAVIDF